MNTNMTQAFASATREVCLCGAGTPRGAPEARGAVEGARWQERSCLGGRRSLAANSEFYFEGKGSNMLSRLSTPGCEM